MMPEWLYKKEDYVPPKGGGTFAVKTIKSLGRIMERIQFQKGHEKEYALPALLKLVVLILLILFLSVSHHVMVMLLYFAILLAYICTWPSRDIPKVLNGAIAAAIFAALILLPAMILNKEGINNNLRLICKVFLTVAMLNIFNHTTQWNHITGALRKLLVPRILIFTLDITLRYIVLLGRFLNDVLTAYTLRAVGNHHGKYKSLGGVLGITFIKGANMSQEMYEAMRCRGFTDDYKEL